MKILWEPFSFLSTPFVRLSTRPKPHRYVIAIAVFTLLFAQCISHNLNIDKQDDNVDATHKKWLNDNHAHNVAARMASDAKVAISKRQSPTKISNSSSSSRMSTRSNRSTDAPTLLFTHGGTSSRSSSHSTDFPPFTTEKLVTTTRKTTTKERRQQPSSIPTNNVLILIQTHKNIELNLVRDQFQQFTDMFGVKLANITIDFDAIDGKWDSGSVASFIYNVSHLTLIRCVRVFLFNFILAWEEERMRGRERVMGKEKIHFARHQFHFDRFIKFLLRVFSCIQAFCVQNDNDFDFRRI